jgi:shikimate dehydrogenase
VSTRRYALVGDPIAHSPSPAMQQAGFDALGLDCSYTRRPASVADAWAVVNELEQGVWDGCNVTTPLKTVLAPSFSLLGNAARALAVNTVWKVGAALVGELTDVDGVREPLVALGVGGGHGLVLGAGGAARAAALALESLGLTVSVAARRPVEAEALVRSLGLRAGGSVVALADAAAVGPLLARAAVVVQATPAGREGEILPLPWELWPAEAVAFEMLYRPRLTPFLAAATAAQARCIEGWQMLLAQGARSFELWTGREAPRAVMQAALLAELGA